MTKALGHERNDTIDVFRAIAILSVMTYHYTCSTWVTHVGVVHQGVFQLGRFGVHLFFIVSGLVITMTISRSASTVDFAVKRIARIYPAYLVAVALTYSFTKLVKIPQFWISPQTLVQNVLPYNLGQALVDPSYWSLSYELQFYAYVALFYFTLKDKYWIGLLGLTVAGAMLSVSNPYLADKYLMAAYMPLFLAGVATWMAVYERKPMGWVLLAAAFVFYIPAFPRFDNRPHSYSPWMLNLFILGLGGGLIALLAFRVKLRGFWLAWIGRISYSLYLIHQVIGLSVITKLKAHGVPSALCIAVAAALSIGLGWLMFRFVEEPGRRLVLKAVDRASIRLRGPQSSVVANA